jgi:hypothetical protein
MICTGLSEDTLTGVLTVLTMLAQPPQEEKIQFGLQHSKVYYCEFITVIVYFNAIMVSKQRFDHFRKNCKRC